MDDLETHTWDDHNKLDSRQSDAVVMDLVFLEFTGTIIVARPLLCGSRTDVFAV
jgi:hypothetical protein